MAFPVKDWRNAPDATTPISAEALEDLEKRVTDYTDYAITVRQVNAKDYGARGDGTTNDTAAINAAIAAVPNGGIVYFPPGKYRYSTPLNLSSKTNIVLAGAGGVPDGQRNASTLYYVGASSPGVDLSSSVGCSIRDLAIAHASGGLSGTLVDATSAAFLTIERCTIGGDGPYWALAKVFNIDGLIVGEFRDCYFLYGTDLVYGRASNATYTNSILFQGCEFTTWSSAAVRNPGESWTFNSCTWQAAAWSGNSNTAKANGIVSDSGIICKALTVTGCWAGDVTGGTGKGDWIQFSGDGLVVQGNMLGGCESGVVLGTNAPATGVVINGNLFDGAKWAVNAQAPPASAKNERWTITNNTHKNITSSGFFIVWAAGSMPTGGSVVQNESNNGSGGGFTTASGGTGQLLLGTIPVKAGAVSDASFPIAPPDGTMALDSTNNRVYFRLGGAWKYAALT